MICDTCGAEFRPRSSINKFCSDVCTPYKNWAMAWDTWRSMHKRCKDPRTNGYSNYGGKGIQVCKEWESYSTFLSDMGYKPSRKHQLDRKDSSKNYCKDNCRWVSAKENAANKSSTKEIEFEGEVMCQSDWAKKLELSDSTLSTRIEKWGVEKALTTPHGPTGPKPKRS